MLDRIPPKTFTPVGEGEAATVTGYIELGTLSKVVAISVDFTGTPAGAELIITDSITKANVLSYTGNTDQTFRPVATANKSVGGGASTLEVSPVAERLKVEIKKSVKTGSVKLTVIIDSGFAV